MGQESPGGNGSSSSLDYTMHNCNSWCGNGCLAGPIEVNGQAAYGYVRFRCKAWGCPVCGPKKASRVRRAISGAARDRRLTKFLTLTLNPETIPDDVDTVRYIRGVWSKFRIYLARKFGKPITFISVLEFSKSGVPHLHVLIGQYVAQAWISKTWEALGGGRIVFIKRVIDLHRIGFYLSKYLTKDMILSGPAGTRRYTTSRDIRLFEKRESSGWCPTPYGFEFLYLKARGDVLTESRDRDGLVTFFTSFRRLEECEVTI